jgi:hypothetical protein
MPEIPRAIILEATWIDIYMLETVTGQSCVMLPPEMPILARIRANLVRHF